MTEALPIQPALIDAHREAVANVNRWRGHCVESYARLEWGAHLTLKEFQGLPKLPTVFGERIKLLISSVAEGGAHPCKKVQASLSELEPLLKLRNTLVHAIGNVFVDAHGRWLWHYRYQPSKAGALEERGSILEDQALMMEKQLARGVQSISNHLRLYRETLAKVSQAKT